MKGRFAAWLGSHGVGRARQERAEDISARLLRDRLVFLGTPIDDEVANLIIAQLLFLEEEDHERDISLYINSPGGAVTAGLAVYDTIREHLRPDVTTICLGHASGLAALLLAAGTRGKRFALPDARIQLVPMRIGGESPLSQELAAECDRMNALFTECLSTVSGRDAKSLRADMDNYLSLDAEGARRYGLVDAIIVARDRRLE